MLMRWPWRVPRELQVRVWPPKRPTMWLGGWNIPQPKLAGMALTPGGCCPHLSTRVSREGTEPRACCPVFRDCPARGHSTRAVRTPRSARRKPRVESDKLFPSRSSSCSESSLQRQVIFLNYKQQNHNNKTHTHRCPGAERLCECPCPSVCVGRMSRDRNHLLGHTPLQLSLKSPSLETPDTNTPVLGVT